jgi:hypothetical protein
MRDAALPFSTRLARIFRRIIGAPDYEAYLEHCRAAVRDAVVHEQIGEPADVRILRDESDVLRELQDRERVRIVLHLPVDRG